jgi:hypothetical protein
MSTDKQCDCDACAVVFRLAGHDVGASGDDDILDRLHHQWNGEYDPTGRLLSEAADEIEALREERDRYFASACEWKDDYRALVTLVHAWADADIAWLESNGSRTCDYFSGRTLTVLAEAQDALRKWVGR